MFKYLQVLTVLSAIFNCCLPQRRIYHGTNAKPKQFPYMVTISHPVKCGGALISNKFVITAAHCIMDLFEVEDIVLSLGAHNFYDNGEKGRIKIKAKKYWIHENFTMPSAKNDIALIELPEKVNFTDAMQPIKLAKKESIEKEKDLMVVLSGWGNTQTGYATNLQTAQMKLISFDECIQFKGFYIESITKNSICAVGFKNLSGKPVMACDGDSGSPLVLAKTYELIAITSFVKDADGNGTFNRNDCTSDSVPAVFLKVHPYLSWINEKTGLKL